jgi:tetratricopeptide (TPR) repeat protein
MLATASKRSGDVAKAAQSLFNLGVSFDNMQQYGKAIEVRAAVALNVRCLGDIAVPQAYRKFLKAAKEANNLPAMCLGYNSAAISYQNKGDLENALAYHARHAKVAPDARVRLD